MKLILYANGSNEVEERLGNIIETLIPEKLEIFRTIDSLSRRLRQPLNDVAIAVLLATKRKDLLKLLSIKDLFDDIKIILILPDSNKDTISLGYKLYPRFVSYADSNFMDVAAVLEKMFRVINNKNMYQNKSEKKPWNLHNLYVKPMLQLQIPRQEYLLQ